MNRPAKRPVMLIVRDGWGHNPSHEFDRANAVHLANKPVDERLRAEYPWVQIHTSGEDVGLPVGVMGNSEVGHQNIGAGRIVDQEIMRVTRTIRDGSFFSNEALVGALEHAARTGGSFHLMGLVSDGRVHSDLEHAFAVIDLVKESGFPGDRFFIHAILDGRDTSPFGGIGFIEQIEQRLKEAGVGRVSDVIGRFYAMDRDYRWERVEQAYRLFTQGSSRQAKTSREAIQAYYDAPTDASRNGDEFVLPTSICPSGELNPAQTIRSGDSVFFFNVRGDRPREIIKAFILPEEDWKEIKNGGFARGERLSDLYFATMAEYEKGLDVHVAFNRPPKMKNILAEYIANMGLQQFRCAESEKAPHVTFFFNDYRESPEGPTRADEPIQGAFPGETQLEIPSPKEVPTYDQKPEMSADAVTDAVLAELQVGRQDVYIVNYANGDMVGHTGSIPAAVKAVETVDRCVGLLVDEVLARGGAVVVTADHGNAEQMIDPETQLPHTAHTTFDVDLIVVDAASKGKKLREGGRLADVAPTLLDLLGLPKPAEMTGESLIVG